MKQVETSRKIGLWMDHSQARLLEPGEPVSTIRTVASQISKKAKIDGEEADGIRLGKYRSSNNEYRKHNRRQNMLAEYYKTLAKEIHPYDEIFLSGSTTALEEFKNFLSNKKSFLSKRIHIMRSDYLSDNQLAALLLENTGTISNQGKANV